MSFNVTMPDGTLIEDIPDGTSKEEVQRRYEAMTGNRAPLASAANPTPAKTQAELDQEAYDNAAWYEKLHLGANETMREVGYGLQEMIPGMPELTGEERQMLDRSRAVDGGLKTTGEIAGDVGLLAVPGTRLATSATTLPRAIGAESALVGLYEGLKNPAPEESRAGNAAIGAATTAAGGTFFPLALRAAGNATRGVVNKVAPIDDTAQEMIDAGVKLTPGMARPNLAGVEKFMGRIPGVSGKVEDLQKEALVSWNNYIQRNIGPVADDLGVTGTAGFKELQDRFGQAYNDVWGAVSPKTLDTNRLYVNVENMANDVGGLPGEFTGMGQKAIEDTQTALIKFSETGDTTLLDALDDTLRNYQQTAGPGIEFFGNLRNTFRQALPDDTAKKLSEVDAAYRNYAVTRRAGTYVDTLVNEGIFTPRSLLGAVKAKNSEQALVTGSGAMQSQAKAGGQVLGRTLPNRLNMEEPASDLGVQVGTSLALLNDPSYVGVPTAIAGMRGAVNPRARDFLTRNTPYRPGATPNLAALSGLSMAELLKLRDPDNPLDQARAIADELRRTPLR